MEEQRGLESLLNIRFLIFHVFFSAFFIICLIVLRINNSSPKSSYGSSALNESSQQCLGVFLFKNFMKRNKISYSYLIEISFRESIC